MEIKNRWVTWEELHPYKEQLIDLELDLMIKFHYPDKSISRSYPESRVENLKKYLNDGSTYLWLSTQGDKLLGYYWAYISTFIDRKRWNLRSIMISEEAKGKGLGSLAVKEGLKKAKELNCDEAATEYVPWNRTMEAVMMKNGYQVTRIEVVKKL